MESAATAPSAMEAMTAPMETSVPSGTMMVNVPSVGDSSSEETLSVSKVTSVSPLRTALPEALCQRATLAEVMDSPKAGTLISSDMAEMGEKVKNQMVKAALIRALVSR
jgi:hypothetical protein